MSADVVHHAADRASFGDSTTQQSPGRLRDYHRTLLWMAVTVIVAAFLLHVRSDQKVELTFLRGWPAPELCQSRALLGWDCPGCGLTRSFIYLAHGDMASSLAVQRVGWLVALLVVLQIPYRLWALRSADGQPLGRVTPWVIAWTTIVLLFANWIANVVTRLT